MALLHSRRPGRQGKARITGHGHGMWLPCCGALEDQNSSAPRGQPPGQPHRRPSQLCHQEQAKHNHGSNLFPDFLLSFLAHETNGWLAGWLAGRHRDQQCDRCVHVSSQTDTTTSSCTTTPTIIIIIGIGIGIVINPISCTKRSTRTPRTPAATAHHRHHHLLLLAQRPPSLHTQKSLIPAGQVANTRTHQVKLRTCNLAMRSAWAMRDAHSARRDALNVSGDEDRSVHLAFCTRFFASVVQEHYLPACLLPPSSVLTIAAPLFCLTVSRLC